MEKRETVKLSILKHLKKFVSEKGREKVRDAEEVKGKRQSSFYMLMTSFDAFSV